MSCNQSYKYIRSELSDREFAEHIKGCATCAKRIELIDQTMAVLDEIPEIPAGLTEKVMQRKGQLKINPVISSFDLNKYLQLAAVIAIGIFLGTLLGSRANSELFLSKKEKKDKALLEYRESHHLNDQSSIYRF